MPKFTQIVYLSILIVITNLLSAQTKTLVEINNPVINLTYPNKLISIKALSGKNFDGDKLTMERPIVEIESEGLSFNLRSAEALFDKTKNILELNKDARLLSDKEDNQIRIASEKLVFDIKDINEINLTKEKTTNKIIKRGLLEKIFGGVGTQQELPTTP